MLHAQTLVLLTRILCPEAEISDKQKKKKTRFSIQKGTWDKKGNGVKKKKGK